MRGAGVAESPPKNRAALLQQLSAAAERSGVADAIEEWRLVRARFGASREQRTLFPEAPLPFGGPGG